MVESGNDWAEALPQILYGYKKRDHKGKDLRFRLMYRVNPKMLANDSLDLLNEASITIGTSKY